LVPPRYTDRSGIVEEMGIVVSLVLGRGMVMVSQPGCIAGNMPIPEFVEDSRTRVDGLGSCCIVVALGVAGDDVVERDTDLLRANRGIAVVAMHRVADRMNRAMNLAYPDAYLAMELEESAKMKRLTLDYVDVCVLEVVVVYNSLAHHIHWDSRRYVDWVMTSQGHSHWAPH